MLRSSMRTLAPFIINLVIAHDAVFAFTAAMPKGKYPSGTVYGKSTEKRDDAGTVTSFVCVVTVVTTFVKAGRPAMPVHGTLLALFA